ncbi:MAG: hypothetical protein C4321_04105, partial [Chloroflexota bacterium]
LGWATSAGTLAGVGLGTLLIFGVHAHEPQAGLPTNPVFPDADSIARGRALYEANCVTCHGRTGVPPPGLNLEPYPLDLTVHVPQHPDAQADDSGTAGTKDSGASGNGDAGVEGPGAHGRGDLASRELPADAGAGDAVGRVIGIRASAQRLG